jgi:hypothetical protein
MGEPSLRTPQSEDRLDSWKEIAACLKRDVRTVERWEKREEMPVRRHLHDRIGSVYASQADLDAWMRGRNLRSESFPGEVNRGPLQSARLPIGPTYGHPAYSSPEMAAQRMNIVSPHLVATPRIAPG